MICRLVALTCALLVYLSASATPVLSYALRCFASAPPNSDLCASQNGPSATAVSVSDSAFAEHRANPGEFNGSANAGAGYGARVDYGSLGLTIGAGAVAEAPQVPSGGGSRGAQSEAFGRVQFIDDVIAIDPTLPLGTTVQIAYEVPVHGEIHSSIDPGGQTTWSYDIVWDIGGINEVRGSGSANPDSVFTTEQGIFTVHIGQPEPIGVALSAQVDASAFPFMLSNKFQAGSALVAADFFNTVELFLTPLDPNVTLMTSSGHDYTRPSNIPEPPTVVLLGLALAAASFAQRRRLPPYFSYWSPG